MYKTQMEAARKNIVTPEMEEVLLKEAISREELLEKMALGQIVIPKNINHKANKGIAIGAGLKTKINVNLGISEQVRETKEEMDKVRLSEELGAHSIMDLSNYGATKDFRAELIRTSPLLVGTVPMYDILGYSGKKLKDLEIEDFFQVVEEHCKNGVDFLTIHAGLTSRVVDYYKNSDRITGMVSRGGGLLYAWMELNGAENPFYEHFDRLMDLLYEYDVTISLGDGLRPGATHDSTDASQIMELIELGELTRRAWHKNVQVIIEGPGHMTMDEIEANVILQKKLCHGAPFYVLGPLVSDVFAGYDHITAAIGGAIAAAAGADFLCYVTPAEHLALPNLADVKEGIIASRIAGHAADLAKKVPGARGWDDAMSKHRKDLCWESQFELVIDEEKARDYFFRDQPEDHTACSMCGKMCPMMTTSKLERNEEIDL